MYVLWVEFYGNILFYSGGGRRGTGISSSSGLNRPGRSTRRQPGSSAAGHSGQSANSGESLGDDDDEM